MINMSKQFAVIRVRGTVSVKNDIRHALESIRLRKPNHCVILPNNEYSKGVLQKTKDYVTWGEISDDMLKTLVSKRGKTNSKTLVESKDVASVLKKIKDGAIKDSGIKPVFQLSPPVKGYERGGIKKAFSQKGALGFRGDKINDLVAKMI